MTGRSMPLMRSRLNKAAVRSSHPGAITASQRLSRTNEVATTPTDASFAMLTWMFIHADYLVGMMWPEIRDS